MSDLVACMLALAYQSAFRPQHDANLLVIASRVLQMHTGSICSPSKLICHMQQGTVYQRCLAQRCVMQQATCRSAFQY